MSPTAILAILIASGFAAGAGLHMLNQRRIDHLVVEGALTWARARRHMRAEAPLLSQAW